VLEKLLLRHADTFNLQMINKTDTLLIHLLTAKSIKLR